MTNIFVGLGYNFTGFGFFCKNRTLWKWVLLPFLLDLVIGFTLVFFYIRFFTPLQEFFARPFAGFDIVDPHGLWQHIQDLGYWFLRGILRVVIFFLSLLVLWFVISLVTALVNAPFYEMLCEKVLILKGCRPDDPFTWRRFKREWWHATKIGFWRFLFLGLPAVLLLLLSVMPVVGLFFAIFYFFYLSWCSAFGVVAYGMTLMERPFREMWQFARQNIGLFFGFGLPALIPILGPFFLSFQIVGGTLLYVEKKLQK